MIPFRYIFPPDIAKMTTNHDVDGLIRILEHQDKYKFETRKDAIKALGILGDSRAVDPLICELDYMFQDIKETTAEALGMIGDVRAIKPLIEHIFNRACYNALVKIGPVGINQLIETIDDKKRSIQAISILGDIGDASAIKPLEKILTKHNFTIQELKAITNTLDKLRWKPNKDEPSVWYWISKEKWEECEKLGETAVTPLLIVLKHYNPGHLGMDTDNKVHIQVIRTLGNLKDPRSVDPLIYQLRYANFDFVHTIEIGRAIRDSLVMIGKPAVDPLILAFQKEKDKSYLHFWGASALMQIGDIRAKDVLIQVLYECDEEGEWAHFDKNFHDRILECLKSMEDTRSTLVQEK